VFSVRQQQKGGMWPAVAFFWFATLLPLATYPIMAVS
jgi:hypothetical protein